MRICTLLFFFISALTCHSLCAHTPASSYFLMQDSTSSLTSSALPAKQKKTKELFQQNFSYMGIPFIVSGLIVKKQNQDFRTLRNRFQPTFHHEYDNYTQYVPLVTTWGMKLAGVESRSSWKELTVSNVFSAALMAGFVNTLKYTTKETGRRIREFPCATRTAAGGSPFRPVSRFPSAPAGRFRAAG